MILPHIKAFFNKKKILKDRLMWLRAHQTERAWLSAENWRGTAFFVGAVCSGVPISIPRATLQGSLRNVASPAA
jgi:hypothetical protein